MILGFFIASVAWLMIPLAPTIPGGGGEARHAFAREARRVNLGRPRDRTEEKRSAE